MEKNAKIFEGMKLIRKTGLALVLLAFAVFNALFFMGDYDVKKGDVNIYLAKKDMKSEYISEQVKLRLIGKWDSQVSLSNELLDILEESHQYHRANIKLLEEKGVEQSIINEEWGKVVWLKDTKKHGDLAYPLIRRVSNGFVAAHKSLLFWLTFGMGALGGLMFLLPAIKLDGPAGIKNNGIFQNAATNRGWVAWLVFIYLISFYIFLYFFPDYLINQIVVVDGLSNLLNGGNASQWFLYGTLYTVFMTVMGIRMLIKYRGNRYQIVRTISVMFFQLTFAFLIPELLTKFQKPWFDFKNAWPLNYSFFYDWNLNNLANEGVLGLFMLFWGIVLSLVIVPVMVYFYGKRWYCSWVCGCGGLAETLGDPYRQHSDKSIKAWKFERYIIYSVLVFAVLMTVAVLASIHIEINTDVVNIKEPYGAKFLGIPTEDLRFWYGFAIGSTFSGVIGTGFYPIFGNRVWCRFGCPLAAYMGIVQRFKSRFRITTNGGQCISCGNCSTYCEQGIDVRAYAQKGKNIVRSSCVGCGICSAVCPRGVLKLENGPEEGRIPDDNPIVFGNEGVTLKDMN